MIEANGTHFHVAEIGKGQPLLLLQEFLFTWEPVMTRLADRFRLIAPDLRGFGDSGKPAEAFALKTMLRICWNSWTSSRLRRLEWLVTT